MKDVNGNHIIIKVVNTYKYPVNEFIYEQLNQCVVEICTDKHGCCVIQKCIEAASTEQRKILVMNIIKHTSIFILNQYANYVLQFIVVIGNQEFNRELVNEIFKANINYLSRQRFSSNVIEKCFDNLNKEYQELIIKELSKEEIIRSLLFDMYGNYVLQKALQLSSEPYYSIILSNIAKHIENLKNYSSFGSKLYIKLVNTYPQLNRSNQMTNNQVFEQNINQNTFVNQAMFHNKLNQTGGCNPYNNYVQGGMKKPNRKYQQNWLINLII